jgi:hypothetical protein
MNALNLIQPTISLEMPVQSPYQPSAKINSYPKMSVNKGNNKITEFQAILQRESQTS